MDIFNRPPVISEDTLQYNLYPPPNLSDKASVTTFAACIRTHVDALIPNFIWHRDAFELKVVPNPDLGGEGWLLEGRMRVGDCVDDEWFTVWLLKEISAKWDFAICVFDTDGEFLLIEAADDLPSWVQPANAENRVWIYGSRLHLIPVSHISPPSRNRHRRALPGAPDEDNPIVGVDNDTEDFISAEDAVKLVRDISVSTLAPPGVEKTVWERISKYPTASRSHMHVAKAYVPSDIAKSLIKYPLLIQKAVETFYTRDAIQLRAAHRMSRFPPNTSILREVKMTRTAYAQLVGQKFFPPKVFGHWKENENTPEWRWRDIGMKIAIGFEILYQESKGRSEAFNNSPEAIRSSAEAKKDALRRDPEYVKYIQNLISMDYFKGEVEGSALWNLSENRAAEIFVEVRRQDDAKRESFASQVNAATSEYPTPPVVSLQGEDPDDWLDVNAQAFESMLERTMRGTVNAQPDTMDVDKSKTGDDPEEKLASEQALKLKELATKVENFVEGEGGLEGAIFEDDTFSDEALSDSDNELDPESDEDDEKVSSATRQADMNKLVPGLEPSDYGKMPPSFHVNSQRVAPTTIESEKIGDGGLSEDIPAKSRPQSSPRVKPIRKPIISRDHYDGVDSDDETDEEGIPGDDESDEDRPQVVGDVEIDMEDEEEEFLEFSRQALGITDTHWNEILQDRRQRGAFVPASVRVQKNPKLQKISSEVEQTEGRVPAPGPRPNVNPNLDSFEAVMRAMDAELARTKPHEKSPLEPQPPITNKGKEKAAVEDEDEGEDMELDMDEELRAALEKDEDQEEEPMDYNLIKNFLESFKSQAGLSGPVSNLAGRLQPGWGLPRDES